MLTSGRFLVSFEVPGPLPGTTEGFCEEMNVVYRTEELNTYLRYPKQEINPWHNQEKKVVRFHQNARNRPYAHSLGR